MKIGLIGDHISDIYIYGKMSRFSPESPLPIFDFNNEEIRSGGAANVYRNLLALGNSCLYYRDIHNVSIKKRYVCDNHIMFRVDEDKLGKLLMHELVFPNDCEYIILSDYGKGALDDSYDIIQKLKDENKIVIVDPKKELRHYEGANIVKMNEKEYYQYCGWNYKDYGIDTLIVTRGGKGCTIFNDDGVTDIPINNIQVSDVTGAGDIFVAALTHYLANGKNIYNACDLANQLASISVSHFGTYVLTKDDIKSVDKKVVFTNGCFDILHKGHIEYLRQSRALGDKLIVGLNSDDSVRRRKGDKRPINNQEDRKKLLEALEFVDEVIIFDEDKPYELMKRVQPDIITKGGDYANRDKIVGHDLAEVVILPFVDGYSTTKTLEHMNGDC